MSDRTDSLMELGMALGDDELVLGHRHSEWTGHAPHIEEDVAFSSIAQDEIGHAAGYYAIVAGALGRDPDDLALGRAPGEYRHALLCERPNGHWGYTLARHWLYDHADDARLTALEDSAHADLAALVTKIRREERYHLLHADAWLKRVALGPVEGRVKLIEGLSWAWPDTLALFEALPLEDDAVKQGWMPVPSSELRDRFATRAARALDELGLPTEEADIAREETAEFIASSSGDLIAGDPESEAAPPAPDSGAGGRSGRHSPDFDELWEAMTAQYRAHPGARW